jgi:hypothetical protein
MTTAEPVTSQQEYEAALARIEAYREQLERADKQADQNSLDRARDLELLYQSMQWVDQLPAPKHQVWRGRPVDPRSRNRFASWVLQNTGLNPGTVRRLHAADEVVNSCSLGAIKSERAIRPLLRLRRAGYGDRIPEVYKMAVQLAEGQPPTSAETKQAVRDFLAKYTTAERRQRQAKNWFEQRRASIIRDFNILLEAGQNATAEETLNEMLAAYHAHVPEEGTQ